MPVRVVECLGYFESKVDRLADGELPVATQPRPQGLAFDVRHCVPEQALRLARIKNRQDVGVAELRGGLDLSLKPLSTDRCGQFRSQDFERNLAIVLEIAGEIDSRHAAATELALERVTVAKGLRELSQDVGHGDGSGWKVTLRMCWCRSAFASDAGPGYQLTGV